VGILNIVLGRKQPISQAWPSLEFATIQDASNFVFKWEEE
jgi:hypothetical protein